MQHKHTRVLIPAGVQTGASATSVALDCSHASVVRLFINVATLGAGASLELQVLLAENETDTYCEHEDFTTPRVISAIGDQTIRIPDCFPWAKIKIVRNGSGNWNASVEAAVGEVLSGR